MIQVLGFGLLHSTPEIVLVIVLFSPHVSRGMVLMLRFVHLDALWMNRVMRHPLASAVMVLQNVQHKNKD
jgi:hypothetical protein